MKEIDSELKKENQLLKEEIDKLKKEKDLTNRKYLPTLSELIDRLSINQIKELKISEHKDKYATEIEEILNDIDQILNKEKVCVDANMIRDIIILGQYNLHIWINEAEARKGNANGNNLIFSHSLNGIRCRAKNKIQAKIGGRKDYKLDIIQASPQWIPSGYENE